MQAQPTSGCSDDEFITTQQQPWGSSQLPHNWQATSDLQFQVLGAGPYAPNDQYYSWQQDQAPELNAGSSMNSHQQYSWYPEGLEDQTTSADNGQVGQHGISGSEQLQGTPEHLLTSSPSKSVSNGSLSYETSLLSSCRTVLQKLLSPDGDLHTYFLFMYSGSCYILPCQCRMIATIILRDVVKIHGMEVPWQYMEELAKELVRLCPFLGDPDDPERGYRLWFNFRSGEKARGSGYLLNKLRYLKTEVSEHSGSEEADSDCELEETDSDWESEEEDDREPMAGVYAVRIQQLERRNAYTRRQIAIQNDVCRALLTIGTMFPGFFAVAGRIPQDFYTRYPRLNGRFKRNWPRIAASLRELDSQIKILEKAGVEWDYVAGNQEEKDLAAAVLLSYLVHAIPKSQTEASGGNGLPCDVRRRASEIIRFMTPDAYGRKPMLPHPHIVVQGYLFSLEAKHVVVCIDGVPVRCTDVPEALETLFAAHFVLKIPFPPQTRPFLEFIQCGLYERVPLRTEELSTDLRQLLSQVRGPLRGGISFQQYGSHSGV